MEIEILEEKKNRMVVEIKGESHGFCNALKKALWGVKGVNLAGYSIDHPLVCEPKIIIETEGTKAPKDALLEGAKKLGKDCDDFLKSFSKQVK